MQYFKGSFIFTVVGFLLALAWAHHAHAGAELATLFIVAVLSILEVSLSFDNAVVNAVKLEKMSPVWQHRFLTWGIFIAVFGMRFLFPILIVAVFAHLNLLSVLDMAINNPDKYSHYLHVSHPPIITFGGCFLMMLFFTFFFNPEKKLHWIKPIEKFLAALGGVRGLNVCLTLIILHFSHSYVVPETRHETLVAGIAGIITYLLIDGISHALEKKSEDKFEKVDCKPKSNSILSSCFINFMYLELIDASFSLDGVLGSFALSKDIFIITIGLSIGAMFVRSLTIMLVEKKTLKEYVYLEHGAHWAIGSLALIMFASASKEISEIITGLIGLVFIVASFVSSVLENKKESV